MKAITIRQLQDLLDEIAFDYSEDCELSITSNSQLVIHDEDGFGVKIIEIGEE